MNLQSATVEQIATFKAAAARRYVERGINPKQANQLFETKMASIAEVLDPSSTGILRSQVAEKIAAAVKVIRSK